MEEESKKEKFNQILKDCIEGKGQQEIVLNENSRQMLKETNKVLGEIKSNWEDLEKQREERAAKNETLTAEQWAMEKCNVKQSE